MGGVISGKICVDVSENNRKETGKKGEEMYFKIKLADIVIGVNAQYGYLREYCKKYIVEEGMPEFTIELTMDDIRAEGKHMDSGEAAGQLPYLETLAALRKIADCMSQQDRFLMHGAVLS